MHFKANLIYLININMPYYSNISRNNVEYLQAFIINLNTNIVDLMGFNPFHRYQTLKQHLSFAFFCLIHFSIYLANFNFI